MNQSGEVIMAAFLGATHGTDVPAHSENLHRLVAALQLAAGLLRSGVTATRWCIRLAKAWKAHREHRQELLGLHDEQLREAGISREAVLIAVATPFWRAYPRLKNSV
jgi:uncharacterized protein YjiS (DUF1127 family)